MLGIAPGGRNWGQPMTRPLFRAIPVEYKGLYADEHLIDLQEFGVSLQGLAKVTNSVVDFYLHGRIVKDSRLYQVRLFASPPASGSVLVEIAAMLGGGQLPLYAQALCEAAEQYIIPILRALIAKRIKRPDLMEKALDTILALASQHDAFAKQVHEGHMQDKAWLQSHIDHLAKKSGAPLKQLVQPIGSTVRQIQVGKGDGGIPVAIGEPEAQALSSPDDLKVEDSREYRGTFDGVDTTNGNCKFKPVGSRDDIPGKITDPALLTPHNPYTHSLDTKQPIRVQAKAVTKDGSIVRLFISDGKEN